MLGMRAAVAVIVTMALLVVASVWVAGKEAPSLVCMAVMAGAFISFVAWRGAKKNENVRRGTDLMAEGRFAQASVFLEEEGRAFQLNPTALCSLGVCRLNLWQLERAVQALDQARLQQPLSNAGDVELADRIQHHLAMALVMFGNTIDGRDWLLQLAPVRQELGLGPLIFAAVAARQEKWSEVRSQLATCRRELLSKPLRALSVVLDAWSTEKLGEPRPPIDRVALYAEAGPEELKKRWPELADFVDRAA